MSIEDKMKKIVELLNSACIAYYTGEEESPISDEEYDRYLSELRKLEDIAGYQLAESPTIRVGYEEMEDKIKHYAPILSLKDTKSIDDLQHFLGEKEAVLSWKLDGVSIVLYYQNGKLDRAVSRGDGSMGKDITRNVKLIPNVPQTIETNNTVIVRGEGCIKLTDFDILKQTPEGEKYRNPRNLASGLINSKGTRDSLIAYMTFIAHSVIFINGFGRELETKTDLLEYLELLKFDVVPHIKVVNHTLQKEIDTFTYEVNEFDYPVDGLVLTLDNLSYSNSLGSTAKYPRDSMAFKWPDITAMTNVNGMKWSVSQTGLITPVVTFDPVEIEGTTVKQASLHNIRIFEDFKIGIGDKIEVFKANKIIPEVKENYTKSNTERYPEKCPVCNHQTVVMSSARTKKLYCIHCAGDQLPEEVKETYLTQI